MMHPILQLGNPVLRLRAEPVPFPFPPEFAAEKTALLGTLDEFRRQQGFGRGIAAPQIGISRRFIALNLGQGPQILINPELTWQSAQTFTMWDDCMCFPWLLVRVRRHLSVSVRFRDEQGADVLWERLDQPLSELLQHEIDHLNGILATDRQEGPNALLSRQEFAADPERYRAEVSYSL